MKILKSGLIFAIIFSILITVFPTDSFAYVSVKGYFRSDGTYVRSHVRSNPNAFKFDNYSWTPSQGLYNTSYYAPTKNYSSDWYTPSYITDPYYYLGKSLYESGQSGLTSYTVPKTITPSYTPSYSGTVGGSVSAPIVPTTPKVTSTCGANEYLSTYSNTCFCNSGYKRNSSGVCEQVICGVNEYLSTYNNTCYCNSGYKRNSSGICEKVVCGENEYLSTWSNECYCNSGYKKNYSTGKCEKVICGLNEYLSTWSNECYCNSGYKKNYSTGQCEQIIVPPNAHLSSWSSQGWYCDTGYKQVGNSCQPE